MNMERLKRHMRQLKLRGVDTHDMSADEAYAATEELERMLISSNNKLRESKLVVHNALAALLKAHTEGNKH